MFKVQEYVMKREEVPDSWLGLTTSEIANHLTDETMETEVDPGELEGLIRTFE